jgi:hypothetical protein
MRDSCGAIRGACLLVMLAGLAGAQIGPGQPVPRGSTPASVSEVTRAASPAVPVYLISTLTGGKVLPTPLPGTQAGGLGGLQGAATDRAGNLYIASPNVVYKLDPSGTLTRVAGTSAQGFSGDNGPAVNAQLFGASGLAVDAATCTSPSTATTASAG